MFNNGLKTVLITGSSGGIGKEVSIYFADKGWNVICHYNSSQKSIKELEYYFMKNNITYHFLKCDFADSFQFNSFIDNINDFKIDTLINNAGVSMDCHGIEDIIRVFTINTFSAMMITTKVFEKMKDNKFGRIVNISSIGAKYGSSISSMSYGCSKLAIEGVTKTFAREGYSYNVLVNTIRPGVINTDFHKKTSKDMQKRVSLIPLLRMGDPKDISRVAYMIGSEENNFITNEIIMIAGGE